MMRKSRKKNEHNNWWNQPQASPTDNAVALSARGRRAARYRWIIIACLCSFPVLAFSMLYVLSDVTSDNSSSVVQTDGPPVQVRAAALDTVDRWVNDPGCPLSDPHVLGFDSADVVPLPDVNNNKLPTYTTYNAHVIVASQVSTYMVSVNINYDPAFGVDVIGNPTLMPVKPSQKDWSDENWAGTKSLGANEPIKRAVSAWSKAFTSGNVDELTTVVGDPDSNHLYFPLTGIGDYTENITLVATRAVDKGADPDESVVMVHVDLAMNRAGVKESSVSGYDLLIDSANTGSARVVAWGPTGSGPTLQPFENAVSDVPAPEPEPTVNPTASATPGGRN
ncbi:hypothetical protein [Actinomyces vulturis]|uniref:hypothetical protein n=1 Tax=Actinomyces vulturis TaxID=1857645 RepID=UPI0008327697|nr:hypothetical protein [Actinomyces vulturis]